MALFVAAITVVMMQARFDPRTILAIVAIPLSLMLKAACHIIQDERNIYTDGLLQLKDSVFTFMNIKLSNDKSDLHFSLMPPKIVDAPLENPLNNNKSDSKNDSDNNSTSGSKGDSKENLDKQLSEQGNQPPKIKQKTRGPAPLLTNNEIKMQNPVYAIGTFPKGEEEFVFNTQSSTVYCARMMNTCRESIGRDDMVQRYWEKIAQRRLISKGEGNGIKALVNYKVDVNNNSYKIFRLRAPGDGNKGCFGLQDIQKLEGGGNKICYTLYLHGKRHGGCKGLETKLQSYAQTSLDNQLHLATYTRNGAKK